MRVFVAGLSVRIACDNWVACIGAKLQPFPINNSRGLW